jgi:hypothetical protein
LTDAYRLLRAWQADVAQSIVRDVIKGVSARGL